MINFAQTMAERYAPKIRCNVVAPGFTKTSTWEKVTQAYIDRNLALTLQKEFVAPEEIAAAFVFLAETPHITGQTITIDAGWQRKTRAGIPSRKDSLK